MKKGLLFLLFMMSFLVSFSSFAGINPSSPANANNTQEIIMKGKIPAGVTIKKNKVTLKAGYSFTRVSESKATVSAKKKKDGTISGEFTCGCQSSSSSGSCKLIIDGSSIWCSTNTCGSTCQMTVSIPNVMSTIQ